MALNVTPGTGAVIDSDTTTGEHRQNMLLAQAADSGVISASGVSALVAIANIDVSTARALFINFTTTVSLTAFVVEFRAHAGGSYVTIASASADYTSPGGPVLGASGNLKLAGPGVQHWLQLNVEAVQAVRIRAASTNAVISGAYFANNTLRSGLVVPGSVSSGPTTWSTLGTWDEWTQW